MSTGMICPRWFSVAALYALQKSMMLMPCGPNAVPTGGAGVAPPAWIWIFTTAASFFFAIVFIAPFTAHRDHRPRRFVDMSCVASCGARVLELGHLAELQLDRGLAAEDVHQHLELRAVDVDLADRAVEIGERPRGDPHLLAHLVLEPRPHLLLLLAALDLLALAQPLLDLAAGERRGLGATADEPGDARRVAHHVPGVVVEREADEQVARPHLLLHHDLAAVLDLDDERVVGALPRHGRRAVVERRGLLRVLGRGGVRLGSRGVGRGGLVVRGRERIREIVGSGHRLSRRGRGRPWRTRSRPRRSAWSSRPRRSAR